MLHQNFSLRVISLFAALLLAALVGSGTEVRAQSKLEFEQQPPGAVVAVRADRLRKARKTGRITIPLPSGEQAARAIVMAEGRSDGIDTLRAQEGATSLFIASNGKDAFGLIEKDGRTYVIQTVDGQVMVANQDRLLGDMHGQPEWSLADDFLVEPEEIERLRREALRRKSVRAPSEATTDGATVVDIAIFYEPAIEDTYGAAWVRTLVHGYVGYTNEAFRRSGVQLNVRPVFVGRYPGTFPDTPALTFSDPVIRDLAQQYGADLRFTIWVAPKPGARPGLAGRDVAHGAINSLGYRIFAHEVGHMLWAHHPREANEGPRAPGPVYDYNYAFRCGGAVTIMWAGVSGTVTKFLWHYSTPSLSFGGEPCGVAFDQPNGADNAKAIDVARTTVAAYRPSQPIVGSVAFADAPRVVVSERAGKAAVKLRRDGDLAQATSVEVYSIDMTTTAGRDYKPVVERVTFAPGQSERQIELTVLDDEVTESEEQFKLVLASPHKLNVTGGELVVAVPVDSDIDLFNPTEELKAIALNGLLRWGEVPGADMFEVWVYRDAALSQVAEFSGGLTSRQYQFQQLAPGTPYFVKILYRAGGTWYERTPFEIRTAESVLQARLISPQDELEAFVDGGTLRWSAIPGAQSYEVWVYQDAELNALVKASGTVRETQYQLDNLVAGQTYYVQVYAKVNGEFFAGAALPVTVSPQSTKARIVNPQEELEEFATDGILRWTPVTGATSYEVWIYTNPNASEIFESSGGLAGRSYQTRRLAPGTSYYAQVYAQVDGQWRAGAPVRLRTATQVTKARLTNPQLELDSLAPGTTLRWSEVPGADAYELWVYTNPGLGKVAESHAAGNTRSYQPTSLCAGGSYFVQVFARLNGQWSTGWPTRVTVADGAQSSDCVPPAPAVSLRPDKAQLVEFIDKLAVSWEAKFADTCSLTHTSNGAPGIFTNMPVPVKFRVGPWDGSEGRQLFSLSCTGPGGTTLAQTLVTGRKRTYCELFGCTVEEIQRLYGD